MNIRTNFQGKIEGRIETVNRLKTVCTWNVLGLCTLNIFSYEIFLSCEILRKHDREPLFGHGNTFGRGLPVGGPFWLLKLRQMGTYRVQMKEVLSWLVWWARCAGTRDFYPCLGCSSRSSTKYFFLHRTLFHFMCPYRPATWAGSRAGSPFS